MKGGGQMGEFVDYEYEAILKKTEEQKAIKAEEKRELKAKLIGCALVIGMLVLLLCAAEGYRKWLWRDFTPPAELLTEAEFRELVEGYPLLAEAYGCGYSEDMEVLTCGDLDLYKDRDGDGEWDIRVYFPLYGRYKTTGHVNELREAEPYALEAFAYRYSIFDLGKGKPHTPWEEHIFGGDHTANLSITVRDPSPDHAEFRAEVEELLRIVRGE